jgi:glycosyltransferase involved in cell wall biosynthesis
MNEFVASRRAPIIIVLKAGPIHTLEDHIEFQALSLSHTLSGEYWTFGPLPINREVGNFKIDCAKVPETNGHFLKLLYMFRRIVQGIRTVRAAGRDVVLISYDPFQNGLTALAIRVFTSARFICEVNGVYGSRENLIDLGAGWRASLKFSVMKLVARFVIARADGVRLLYREQLEGLELNIPESRIRCYPDAVRLDRFVDLGSEKMVLFAGHPFLRKGVDILLSAFEGLQDEFPDWSLVIAGHEMPDQVAKRKPSIRRLSVMRGMPNVEMARWIGRAGILVLPSRSEAMGRVLIEAAAAKKPRIASRVGGTYTVVRDGVDGILVPPENVIALQNALRRLMGSETLRRQYGEAGHKMVNQLFSSLVNGTTVLQFVESVCKRL